MKVTNSLRARTPKQLAERVWIRSSAVARRAWLSRPGRGAIVSSESSASVSLTTYGKRTESVHLTIESIAQGLLLPARIILWLDPADWRHPPTQLRLLADRGLELREAQAEWGPHKKYYPYCREFSESGSVLVTADDDIFYSKRWLSGILAATVEASDTVIAYRARKIEFAGLDLAPYASWRVAASAEPSLRHVAIGMAGVAYPPRIQAVLAHAGEDFMRWAPRADDLWLHVQELRSLMPVAQVSARAADFPVQPGSQDVALALANQTGDGNDSVIRGLYTNVDLEILRRA